MLLAAVTVGVFWQVSHHQFISYDDNCYVTDNRYVQAGISWNGLEWAFCRLRGENTYWHPLTWVSHMLDCRLFGLNPAGHHLVNMLFHTLNVLLVFLVFQRITKAFWRCAVLAALFALHPLQVDTVAWVAERKNLLSACFWLLTVWAYVCYTERPRVARYALVVALYAMGLMCKPVLVTLPFVLLLLDYWPLQRLQPATLKATGSALARLGWEKSPLFLLAGVSCLITIAGHRTMGALQDAATLPMGLRIENAVVSYVRYIGKTVFPANLAVLYPYPEAWPVCQVALCGLLLVAISGLALRMLLSRPYLFVGWSWFLGVLVPFIGVIQAGHQPMADRFMYVPLIGLFLLVVWGLDGLLLDTWPQKQRWLAGATTLALVGCLVVTTFQLGHWQNSQKLFRHAIEVTTDNYVAYDALGLVFSNEGKHDEALPFLFESLGLKPGYSKGQYDLGTVFLRMGRLDEAVRYLTAAVKNDPDFAYAHINLGKALLEQGKLSEAAVHLSEAVRLTPDDPEAHYNLGTVLLMQTKPGEAIACFTEALRLKPDYGGAHGNLGIALMGQGKLGEGAAHLSAALRLNPDSPSAHDNLGLALFELNQTREAGDHFSEALRLNPDSAGAHYHLALALVRQDKTKEALHHAHKARDLALAAGQSALAAKAEDLLQQH